MIYWKVTNFFKREKKEKATCKSMRSCTLVQTGFLQPSWKLQFFSFYLFLKLIANFYNSKNEQWSSCNRKILSWNRGIVVGVVEGFIWRKMGGNSSKSSQRITVDGWIRHVQIPRLLVPLLFLGRYNRSSTAFQCRSRGHHLVQLPQNRHDVA